MQSHLALRIEVDTILDDLRRVVAALRQASRAAEMRVGLSAAQLFVLRTLADVDTLSLNEIAARTHTHQSTVSEVVQRLLKRRLLKRTRAKSDGRRLALSVTPAGRKLLERAPGAAQERLIAALARLPAAKRRQLANGMGALVTEMGLADEAPRMLFEEPR